VRPTSDILSVKIDRMHRYQTRNADVRFRSTSYCMSLVGTEYYIGLSWVPFNLRHISLLVHITPVDRDSSSTSSKRCPIIMHVQSVQVSMVILLVSSQYYPKPSLVDC